MWQCRAFYKDLHKESRKNVEGAMRGLLEGSVPPFHTRHQVAEGR